MGERVTETTKLCDTHEMVVVHRVFRREFRLLPAMITAVPGGDVRRARVIGQHASEMVTELHHHHTGEDELLWPRLQERATLHADMVERMEEQHERVAGLLHEVTMLLPQWTATADPATGRRLAEVFTQAGAALNEHLADEEQHILPVVEAHITEQEWQQLGERAIAAMPKSRLLVFMGYILEETDPSERALFLGKIPPPARLAYRLVGGPRYRREIARLRAGLPT
jgi:iron-sulfur cluster repair protein YtfE (RIC family)